MKNSIVNKTKSIISGLICLFFAGFGLYYLYVGKWIEAIAFLSLSAVFCYQFYLNASIVKLDHDGVSLHFLNRVRRFVPWGDLHEIGVIGENVFGPKKNHGDLYFYFSPTKMSERERFNMVVRWPPKKMIYVSFSEKMYESVSLFWHGDIASYNAGDVIAQPDNNDDLNNNDCQVENYE